jgi:hypothetical protein
MNTNLNPAQNLNGMDNSNPENEEFAEPNEGIYAVLIFDCCKQSTIELLYPNTPSLHILFLI